MKLKTLIVLGSLSLYVGAASMNSPPPLSTVSKVDLDRYVGIWHEIARFPNKHQKDCVKTQAEYSYGEKGSLIVKNICSLPDGSIKQVTGTARVEDKITNAKLKVNFVPQLLRWLGIGWGNYWIIELDSEYKFAVVSEPKREYLWILSRNPSMEKATYEGIVNRLKEKGFNTDNLIVSTQAEPAKI